MSYGAYVKQADGTETLVGKVRATTVWASRDARRFATSEQGRKLDRAIRVFRVGANLTPIGFRLASFRPESL